LLRRSDLASLSGFTAVRDLTKHPLAVDAEVHRRALSACSPWSLQNLQNSTRGSFSMAASFTVEASAPGKLILFGEHAVVHGATAVAGALSDLRIFCRVEVEESLAPTLQITIPNIAPGAHKGSEYSHCWPVDQLKISLESHLAELTASCPGDEPSYLHPVNPTPGTLAALSQLLEACDEPQRKGLMPPLFLACAMLRTALLRLTVGHAEGRHPHHSLHLRIHKATLPVAAGLGSSASFSVSAAGALLEVAARLDGSSPASKELLEGRKAGSAAGESGHVPCERFLGLLNKWSYASECLFHGNPSGLDNTVAT
jgi:mevalonate kinase